MRDAMSATGMSAIAVGTNCPPKIATCARLIVAARRQFEQYLLKVGENEFVFRH